MDMVFALGGDLPQKVQESLKVPNTKDLWSTRSGPVFGGTCETQA